MSKIDTLIIVHSEHEGLLSVGNGERARSGIVARESVIRLPVIPVIYKSRVPAFIQYSFNTFNLKFPKEADPASYQCHYKSCSNAVLITNIQSWTGPCIAIFCAANSSTAGPKCINLLRDS